MKRLMRYLAADDGVIVTTAGLIFIASVTAGAYGLMTNGGGAYVDTQKLGYTDEVYSQRESNLRTQRDYFDQRAQEAKASGNAAEAEKWSKASADAGMQLTLTYDVHDDTVTRIANERTGKVIRAGIAVTPAKALEGWALAAKLGNAVVTVGAVQAEQDRRARVEAGLEEPNDEEKEAMLREGRRKAAIAALNLTVPGRDKKLVSSLGEYVTSDLESEVSLVNDPNEYGDSPEGLWLAEVGKYVDEIDPNQSTSAGKNSLVMDSDVKSALKSGKDDDALVLYNGPNGLEPAIVKKDGDGFSATFPLMKGSDPVKFTEDFTYKAPPKRTNSRSCPYLYVFDGRGFVPVNDIFSVSRDPKREYDDQLLFSARGRDGTLPLRIEEVRQEESFIDTVRLMAVDCAPGFEAAVTPEGRVLSVADARTPQRVYGATAAAVTVADGAGAPLRDRASIVARWTLPKRSAASAVLLLTSDGFEDDGMPGSLLGQRPTMTVEVWDGGRWQHAGAVYPKEETDTMAVDLSRWAGRTDLTVRITGASCHSLKYQSIDRIALSTARSDAVKVRSLPLTSATLDGRSVLGALATADDVRVHTLPGDVVRLSAADPGADAYLLTSRGWYRPLER